MLRFTLEGSFALSSYTFLLASSSVIGKQQQGQKSEQNIQQRTLSSFITILPLTMFEVRGKRRSKLVKITANLDQVSKPALDLWFSLFYLPGLLIK